MYSRQIDGLLSIADKNSKEAKVSSQGYNFEKWRIN
jgi:hypothetical protein